MRIEGESGNNAYKVSITTWVHRSIYVLNGFARSPDMLERPSSTYIPASLVDRPASKLVRIQIGY